VRDLVHESRSPREDALTRRRSRSPPTPGAERPSAEQVKAQRRESAGHISRNRRSFWLAAGLCAALIALAAAFGSITMPGSVAPTLLAATTGAKPPDAPSPIAGTSEFIGRESCGACHPAEVKAWSSSHHAHAMEHATDASVEGDFNDTEVTFGGVTTKFFRRDGKFMIRTDGPDGALHDFETKFTFGVAPLQQYLLELPGGRLQAFSIAWDSRPKAAGGQRWFHLHPDETIKAGEPLHWASIQQNWNYECAECHTTNLRRNYDPVAGVYRTSFSEINVSCESCHGPGSRHAAWARKEPGWEKLEASKGLANPLDERRDVSWTFDPKTGNSTRSEPRRTTHEIETCALCHSRRAPISSNAAPGAPIGDGYRVALLDDNLYFPDGQIRDEVYEYGSFLQSRMFHAGVTCSDCHEPHTLALRAPGNGVCLQCHGAARYENVSHHHHAPDSVGAQCASCHMPTRTYMVVDPRRDHSIRVPRPDLSVTLGAPNACNNCHADKSAQWAADLTKAWGTTPDVGFQHYAETLHEATIGAPGVRDRLLQLANDSSNPDIARASAVSRLGRVANPTELESLRKLLHDASPLVRRALAETYIGTPPNILLDLMPLLDDSVRDVRLAATQTLATLPTRALTEDLIGRRDKALEEYVGSQLSNTDRPEAHHNLAVTFMQLGRSGEAESEFKTALKLDPAFVPAAVTLTDLYRSLGRDIEGEPVLRASIARLPSAGSAHFAFGLWLARAGRREEAVAELKQAAELEPDNAHFSYVFAVAIASSGDSAKALELLRKLLVLHVFDRESLLAAAEYARNLGYKDEALQYATRLSELAPGDVSVRSLLQALRR